MPKNSSKYKLGEDRYLVYLPRNLNYLWQELRGKEAKVRVYIEIDDYIELRTLELGVDIIFEPTRTVKKLLSPLNHTKIYWTKRIY